MIEKYCILTANIITLSGDPEGLAAKNESIKATYQTRRDEEYQKYKGKVVEFFKSIKDKVRMEDLRFYR